MNDEMKLLIQAIESLRTIDNPFRDYMFPIISAFFSSLLGAGVAYFVLRYQENRGIEREKMDSVNNWTLSVDNAFSSLVNLKSHYHGNLNKNPFQRTLAIKTILHNALPINEKPSSLSFIAPRKEEPETQSVKWRQISLIRTMANNYNYCLQLWEKRNEIERPIKEKLMQDYSDKIYGYVSQEQIADSVGEANFAVLIDITEHLIVFTDDLLVEMNDFLQEFPEVGKSLINTKKLKRYGTILTYSISENKHLKKIIVKSPEVDYVVLAELYGQTVEEVKKEYETGY